MPRVSLSDVDLHYEETGSGIPLILCHEFASDGRAWEPQLRHFGRRYRVIAFNYRGYPPSSVPQDDAAYLHRHLVDDLLGLMDGLAIERAHVAGIATGGNLALNFAIRHPHRVRGLVVAGAGAGTTDREQWLAGARAMAHDIARRGSEAIVDSVSNAPQRTIFRRKDPLGWTRFVDGIRALHAPGAEKMMRIALTDRAPVTALADELAQLRLPILVMVGDQDAPADEASRFIRAHAPFAGLATVPMCGHTLNVEEPAAFNSLVERFLAAVDAGRWGSWTESREEND